MCVYVSPRAVQGMCCHASMTAREEGGKPPSVCEWIRGGRSEAGSSGKRDKLVFACSSVCRRARARSLVRRLICGSRNSMFDAWNNVNRVPSPLFSLPRARQPQPNRSNTLTRTHAHTQQTCLFFPQDGQADGNPNRARRHFHRGSSERGAEARGLFAGHVLFPPPTSDTRARAHT